MQCLKWSLLDIVLHSCLSDWLGTFCVSACLDSAQAPCFLSVRPSVRLSVTNLVNTIFWKWMNRLCCKLVNDVGRRNSQLWGSQGQRWTVKVTRAEVEAWRRCHSRPRRSSGFSSLASVDVVKWTLLSRLLIHSLRVVDNRPMPGLLAFAFVE